MNYEENPRSSEKTVDILFCFDFFELFFLIFSLSFLAVPYDDNDVVEYPAGLFQYGSGISVSGGRAAAFCTDVP